MQFSAFKSHHLEQVMSIADSTLGSNYLTIAYLNQYLNSNIYLAFVLLEDNKVVGFISTVILTPPQLKDAVVKEKDWFYELSTKYSKIALQKQVIIHPNSIGKGCGSQLVKLSSQVIDTLCDFQLSTVWIKTDNNVMGNIY